jgi:hypothetical protein
MQGEDYEADFEYEDIESDGEDIESDEGWEASGEDVEDVEYVEAESDGEDVESDVEAWETAGEDVESDIEMEAFESDESEGIDEAAVSASARLRASQDRNRRAAFARQVAADQRLEARRAASTQKSITTQIRSIQPGGPAKVYSVGNLQGAGVVTAILPNGRRSRMRIVPTVAPISEVNRLRSVVLVNEKRQAVATAKNSRAIARLATAQAAAVKRLTAQQVKSDKEISKRIIDGHNRLDKRIAKELTGNGTLDRHGKRIMRALKQQRQRSIWNGVLLATSAPFFAAYGDRAKPFSKNNLILTGSLLGWMLGDELIDQFTGKGGALKGGANYWSYLAPIGNGATAYFLLDDKQHERFISGVTTLTAASTPTVDLTKLVAPDAVDDFKKSDHVVMATLADSAAAPAGLSAEITDGILTFTGTAGDEVMWIVDTYPRG